MDEQNEKHANQEIKEKFSIKTANNFHIKVTFLKLWNMNLEESLEIMALEIRKLVEEFKRLMTKKNCN